jgi:hypothetical protein
VSAVRIGVLSSEVDRMTLDVGDLEIVLVSLEKRILDCRRAGAGAVETDDSSGRVGIDADGIELGGRFCCGAVDEAIVYTLSLGPSLISWPVDQLKLHVVSLAFRDRRLGCCGKSATGVNSRQRASQCA